MATLEIRPGRTGSCEARLVYEMSYPEGIRIPLPSPLTAAGVETALALRLGHEEECRIEVHGPLAEYTRWTEEATALVEGIEGYNAFTRELSEIPEVLFCDELPF